LTVMNRMNHAKKKDEENGRKEWIVCGTLHTFSCPIPTLIIHPPKPSVLQTRG
jgi:hypothetical protein